MNVITLYQPYASLAIAGIKTWETRGNPPHGDMCPEGVRGLPGKRINAGDRILIHAARSRAPGWLRWYSPERSDADSDRLNVLESVGVDFHECGDNWWKIDTRSLPLGAILGSVRFEAAIPVRTHVHNPHLPKLDDWSAWICHETDIQPHWVCDIVEGCIHFPRLPLEAIVAFVDLLNSRAGLFEVESGIIPSGVSVNSCLWQ